MSIFRQQAVTSTAPPRRIEPVEHHVAEADMNPYRGNDVHGVPRVATPHDVAPITATASQHFTVPRPEHEPVPVRIVSQGGREMRAWLVIREVATNVQRRIVGQQMERTRMVIQNLGTVAVWIGPDESIAPFMGYRLDVGKERDLTAQADVWCVSDDGTPQAVAILVEYTEPLEVASAIRPGL